MARSQTRATAGPLLAFDRWPDVVYAIGDIHGRLDLLLALERRIVADAETFGGERWLIYLGDYVDRGPRSAAVLDRLMERAPVGFKRFCLAGNHEIMMLRYLEGGRHYNWLDNGGFETLLSYGIPSERIESAERNPKLLRRLVDGYVPEEHLAFLRALPRAIRLPGATFAHMPQPDAVAHDEAGESRMSDDLGLAVPRTGAAERLVHGHRVVERVALSDAQVNIDTGAYLTGTLTALRLAGPEALGLLQTSNDGAASGTRTHADE